MEPCRFKRHVALKWLKIATDSSYHYLFNEKESLRQCLKAPLDSDFMKLDSRRTYKNEIELIFANSETQKNTMIEEANCCVIETEKITSREKESFILNGQSQRMKEE